MQPDMWVDGHWSIIAQDLHQPNGLHAHLPLHRRRLWGLPLEDKAAQKTTLRRMVLRWLLGAFTGAWRRSLAFNFDQFDMHLLYTADPMGLLNSYLVDPQLDTDTKAAIKDHVLLFACRDDDEYLAQKILRTGANPNRTVDSDGWTALYRATHKGNAAIVGLLIKANADVNMPSTDTNETPLHHVAYVGHSELVGLLLSACDDVNVADKEGRTPLHRAKTAFITRSLLKAGADPNAPDKNGWSSLHAACVDRRNDVVSTLLASGTRLNTSDQSGYYEIHLVLFSVWTHGCTDRTLRILQLLVEYGSEWDAMCGKIADRVVSCPSALDHTPSDDEYSVWPHDLDWNRVAPALRVCVERWTQEHAQGLPLTEVPSEQVKRGVNATKIYITELAASRDVVFRRKICVVGPSNWGKTSLIKSLTTQIPTLIHPDDRTIGIDHFRLFFKEKLAKWNATKKHEVTFWDFAGQDAYQVVHSLFFSARTLYIVCIDLESYAIARMQAELMTDTTSEADRRLNEFVDTRILRWVRVICACQPDAEFVFVATKRDRVPTIDLEGEEGVLVDLRKRMANVEVIIQEMKTECVDKKRGGGSTDPAAPLPITHLGDPRLARMSNKPNVSIIVTSCVASQDVDAFKTEIQDVIKASNRGFPMPDKFSLVLKEIVRMRAKAVASATDERITKTFRTVDELIAALVKKIRDPRQPDEDDQYLDENTCQSILETLRDLGDVLWYDSIDDELLKRTIILDPMLMIDLVREIFNHKLTAEVMTHHTLKSLTLWRHLAGTESMLSMKRVLQHFQLVYPTTGEMSATSDLIVPAYWKTNTCAFWMFGGGDLRFGRGIHREEVTIRVHFEYQFVNNFPDTLFDHVVVASYSPFYKRDVGPDWIMYKEDDAIACRLMVGRDHKTHHPLLHLEALQGHSADEDQVEQLWETFTLLAESLETVIRRFPGVVVCRYVREDTEQDVEHTRYTLETLQHFKLTGPSRKWMPPQSTWQSYLDFCRKK